MPHSIIKAYPDKRSFDHRIGTYKHTLCHTDDTEIVSLFLLLGGHSGGQRTIMKYTNHKDYGSRYLIVSSQLYSFYRVIIAFFHALLIALMPTYVIGKYGN